MRGFTINHHTTHSDLRSTAPYSPPSTTHFLGLQRDTFVSSCSKHGPLPPPPQASRQQMHPGIQDSQSFPICAKKQVLLFCLQSMSLHPLMEAHGCFPEWDIIPKAGLSPMYPNGSLGAAASLPLLPATCQERGLHHG